MAGSLTDGQLKSIPRCDHGSMCVLKTGTSNNANHGKSFFICNSSEGRCSYATNAKDFVATVCPMHEKMVELKAFAKKENGIRCYYRCVFGKEKGETWCGHELILPLGQPPKAVLKDITNCINLTEKTKDLDKTVNNKNGTKSSVDILSKPANTNNHSNYNQTTLKDHFMKSVNKSNQNEVQEPIAASDVIANIPQRAMHVPQRLTSVIDMSKSSFNLPRNARISDISDTSSADSNNLSKDSQNESKDEETHVPRDVEVDRVMDSSMLSNNSEDLYNEDELNESSDDITQSADDFENPEVYHVPKDAELDVIDCSMLSNNDHENESNKAAGMVSDTESDDSETEEVYHVPRDATVADVIESSMLSNKDDEDDLNEITDALHDTSITTTTTGSLPESSVFNVPQNAVVRESTVSNKDDEDDLNEITDALHDTSITTTTTDSLPESSVFNVPQNAVVGESTVTEKNTDRLQSTVQKSHNKTNIIEISDSSDDEAEVRSIDVCPTEVRPREVHPTEVRPSEVRLPEVHQLNNSVRENRPPLQVNSMSASLCWSRIQSIKFQLMKQQELYGRMRTLMPDGGQKLLANIRALTRELEETKKQFSESQNTRNPYGSLPMNVHYPSTNDGSVQYTDANNMVQGVGYGGQYRPTPLFGGRMTEKRLKEVVTITQGSIELLHKSLDSRPSPTEESDDPKGLRVNLMIHQKQALAWLLWREKQTPPGGILADDMGLGKTLTMISLTLKSKQDEISQIKELPESSKLVLSKGSVIICPASLIHQWQKEVEKRVNHDKLSVYIYHGASREKRVKKLAKYDIVLTTYNIASIEGKKFSMDDKAKPQQQLSDWHDTSQSKPPEPGALFKIFWRRIILDEGHTIKNHKTASSVAICAMEGESRWIVTGTPIQNNTMELYSLIKFLRVTPFDEYKVWRREVDNKMSSGTKRMNSIVASILLRRTKDQVDSKTGKPLIVLPKRTATLHKLTLSEGELEVYELVQHYSKTVFKRFLDSRKDADNGEPINPTEHKEKEYEVPTHVLGMKAEEALSMLGLHGQNVITQGCLLVLVLRLRQCCTHLSLMCEEIDPELCRTEGIEEPIEERFGNLSIDEDSVSTSRPKEMLPTFSSTKISTLLSCLSDLKKQSNGTTIKSVIVSQWTRMLDIVAQHLKAAGYRYDFITGSVNVKKRSDIVENFNNDKYPEIMLVSLKAGGVGLNLIGGSNLFLLDQHWNPALEDQASDRIYRVGQKNDVTVHRFLCTDTVEERIAALQEKKKALAHSVLYGGKMVQKLTLADLRSIFGLGM